MCVCRGVYVCVYVCADIGLCMCVHRCVCACVCRDTRVCVCVCTEKCVCVVCVWTQACVCVCVCGGGGGGGVTVTVRPSRFRLHQGPPVSPPHLYPLPLIECVPSSSTFLPPPRPHCPRHLLSHRRSHLRKCRCRSRGWCCRAHKPRPPPSWPPRAHSGPPHAALP